MKKNIAYLLIFLFIIGVTDTVMAQAHGFCGTSSETLAQLKEEMFANRREAANRVNPRTNVVTYVPIRFHMVADASGEGRASERNAMVALCNLNTNYAEQDVQFYLEEFNYINNNSIYENPESFSGAINLTANMTYDAINLFVVGVATPGPGGGVTQAYYLGPPGPSGNDWIVCYQNFLTEEYVLTHEMGHFLSLNHPFAGWDFTPWDPVDHGNPVTFSTAPDQAFSSTVELVDGSNCMTAGDGICDTPADYNFGLTYNSGCNYTGNCQDANNDLLVPLEENIMNYFNCSTQTFTEGQKVEIQNSLNSSNRNYCTPNYTPDLNEITGNINTISPNNLETIDTYNYVELVWEAKAGATHYVVEIAGLGDAEDFNQIVETNNLVLTNLEADATYFWKVFPFNESYGCASSTPQRIFKTGIETTATNEIAEIDEWMVAPNPVANNQSLRINLAVSEAFEADITLVDLTGKVVQAISNQQFNVGNATFEMNMNDLPAGLYSLSIRSKNGVSNQRIVVTK